MFFRCLLPLRWGISPHDDRVFELYTRAEYHEMMEFHYPEGAAFAMPAGYAGRKADDPLLFPREVAMVYYLQRLEAFFRGRFR